MSELPSGWTLATVGDTGEYINGMAFKPSDWEKDGRPIIRIQNLTDPSKPINRTTQVVDDRFLVSSGDILVAWSASLGVHLWKGEDAVLNQHIFKVVPESGLVEPKFLFYGLKEAIAELIQSEHLHGSTMKHINRKPFLAHPFPVPPKPEQKRIASKIDRLTAKSARTRTELAKIGALVERYKAAVIDAELASLKPKSENLTIGDIAQDIRYGTSKKSEYSPTKSPVLRIPNIISGSIDTSDLKYGNFEDAELGKLSLEPGDMLFIRSNGSLGLVGRSAVVPTEIAGFLFAGYLIRVRFALDRVHPDFVQLWFSSNRQRGIIEGLARSTSGVNNINSKQIRSLHIALPPIELQRETANLVTGRLRAIDRVMSEISSAHALLDGLDPSILLKAFEGRLVPQDPNDEPASTLLQRLRSAPKPERPRRAKRAANPPAPRAHRRTSSMTKSRFDSDVAGKPYLSNLVKAPGSPVRLEDLYQRAQLAMPDFYKQLAFEVDEGFLVEEPDGLMRRT